MTKKNSAEVVVVLDRSGSMSSIAADMVGGFAALIEEQKKVPGECRVTLARFDTEYEIVYEGLPLAEVPPLVVEPRGGTALLDAIGRTIDATGARLRRLAESKRPERVMLVIITDGEENSSKEYDAERVRSMIDHQQEKYSWNVVFLGSSQSSLKAAARYGIRRANAAQFVATAGANANAVFRGVSKGLASYRSAGVSGDMQANYNASVADATPGSKPNP